MGFGRNPCFFFFFVFFFCPKKMMEIDRKIRREREIKGT